MKCMLCENVSLSHICPSCKNQFLAPSLYKRKLYNNIEVFSFYKYKEIEKFLLTKHTDLGHHLYNILAENSFQKFGCNFKFPHAVVSLGIDDTIENGYSHTAILNKSLQSNYITPKYNIIRAQNKISYAGKSREYRLSHPREFQMRAFEEKEVILVDDIITTGSTLTQAAEVLRQNDKEVLFCLTLADVELK